MQMQSPRPRVTSAAHRLLLALCGGLVFANLSLGQDAARKKAVVEEKTLVTKDGLDLRITYFQAEGGEDSPVVVLLHGRAGNRLVWKNFATKLQQENYAVISVDLSGHGESKSRNPKTASTGGGKADESLRAADYQAMVALDLEAVKNFIFEEHQKQRLNMAKMAIAGADFSTTVAVAFTNFDWRKEPYDDAAVPELQTPRGQDVKALILLSPEDHAPGLLVSQSLAQMKAVQFPVMIGYGKGDTFDKGAAKKVYELLVPKKLRNSPEPYVYLMEYDVKLRGTDLLNRPDGKVELNMFNFLEQHLKSLNISWRDRRSREDRENEDENKK
ncbi:MAG: alpha/beta hydrolase [Planctomycetaceae bacterium]